MDGDGLERWRRVQELFEAAADLRPEQQAAYLAAECADDEALRQEVAALLRSDALAGSFIEHAIRRGSGLLVGAAVDPLAAAATIGSGKYEILGRIGEGGFGVVYKGRDAVLQRFVAVKTCSTSDEKLRRRFFREGQIAAGLQHPNITTVHDLGVERGIPYLVQEFLDGEDLNHKIGRQEALPPLRRLDLLAQVARGLAYAHEQGVLHRDVKPANIRVLPSGAVKIMDFGIAKLLHEVSDVTTRGVTMGTVGYLAPEQLRGEEVDRRTDIFAFGVLAHELLTYERPFRGSTFSEVSYRLLNEEPPPLRELAPAYSRAVGEMVKRCLEKDPARRYATFAEVLAVLEPEVDALRSGPVAVAGAIDAAGRRALDAAGRGPLDAAGRGARDAAGRGARRLEEAGVRRLFSRRWAGAAALGLAALISAVVGFALGGAGGPAAMRRHFGPRTAVPGGTPGGPTGGALGAAPGAEAAAPRPPLSAPPPPLSALPPKVMAGTPAGQQPGSAADARSLRRPVSGAATLGLRPSSPMPRAAGQLRAGPASGGPGAQRAPTRNSLPPAPAAPAGRGADRHGRAPAVGTPGAAEIETEESDLPGAAPGAASAGAVGAAPGGPPGAAPGAASGGALGAAPSGSPGGASAAPPPPFSASAPPLSSPPLPAASRPMVRGDLIPPGAHGAVPPRLLSRSAPKYPDRARRRQAEADVLLLVLVDENGRVERAIVKRTDDTADLGFNEAARKAALHAVFEPATRDGLPGKMWTELPFTFRLHPGDE